MTIQSFFRKQFMVPFETMFALYCIYSGAAGVLNYGVTQDVFRSLLGEWGSFIFNIVYLLAGLGMFFGIGFKKGNVEAFGLITIVTSVFIRMIALIWILGFNPIVVNFCVFTLIFISACFVRLYYIFSGELTLKIKNNLELQILTKEDKE